MIAEVTRTPRGTEWRVRRHVLPWRPRFRWDVINGATDVGELLFGVIFAVLWLPFELTLLLAATVVLVPLRVLGVLRWRVTATLDGNRGRLTWYARGWSAAGARRDQVQAELLAGHNPMRHADKVKGLSRGGGRRGHHHHDHHHDQDDWESGDGDGDGGGWDSGGGDGGGGDGGGGDGGGGGD